MALTITDERIASDVTAVYAEYRPAGGLDGYGAWVVIGESRGGEAQAERLRDKQDAIGAVRRLEHAA